MQNRKLINIMQKKLTDKRKKRKLLHTTNQVLRSLDIQRLRSCKKLSIHFESDSVTGIFGVNGSGKSTVLQALTGIFRPDNPKENTKLSRFFKYTSSANRWIGSSFSAHVDYVLCAGKKPKPIYNKEIIYKKSDDEWTPRQSSKPNRSVVFVPLSDCIPDIEKVPEARVTFTPAEGEDLDRSIAAAASKIMGVKYENLKINKIERLSCFNVERNGIPCHSLNLGAGEQRLFRLLHILFRVPEYTLIIIDELDLTLHTAALKILVDIMCEEAKKDNRHLQIVFSSHRQELMEHKHEGYFVRYLIDTPDRTFCLENPTEDCYELLSGTPRKFLNIYVEDNVSKEIVNHCLRDAEVYRNANVCRYGSITNCVRLAASIALMNGSESPIQNVIFITDGDKSDYKGEELREKINKVISGGGKDLEEIRKAVFSMIIHFNAPEQSGGYSDAMPPEVVIRDGISNLDMEKTPFTQMIEYSRSFDSNINHHNYITYLENKGLSLPQIIDAFAQSAVWKKYVREINNWIDKKKRDFCSRNSDYI